MKPSKGVFRVECRECLERISEDIDGELSNSEHEELKAHLLTCPDCSAVASELRMINKGIQQALETIPVPTDLDQRIIRGFEQERRREKKQTVYTLLILVLLGSPLLIVLLGLYRLVNLFYSLGHAFWQAKASLLTLLPTTTSWWIGITALILSIIGISMIRILVRGSSFKGVLS